MRETELSQAGFIIAKLGGVRSTTRLMSYKSASTVQGWKERGVIPAPKQPEILERAIRAGKDLTALDFVHHLIELERRVRGECSGAQKNKAA